MFMFKIFKSILNCFRYVWCTKSKVILTFKPEPDDDKKEIAEKICAFAAKNKCETGLYLFGKRLIVHKNWKPKRVLKTLDDWFADAWQYSESAEPQEFIGPQTKGHYSGGSISRRSEELWRRTRRTSGNIGLR